MRYWPRVWGENSQRDCPATQTGSSQLCSAQSDLSQLTGLALVLQVVGALPHHEGLGLGEPVLLTEVTVALQVVVAGGPAGEPALAQTEILALSLADVAVLRPHEAPELVVDVTLECPDGSTSSA